MTPIEALIERVEGAQEGERELSCTIARAIGWAPAKGSVYDGTSSPWAWCPDFTESTDAAMSLVPEGWKLRQANFSAPCADDRKWHLNLHGGSVGQDTFVGRGATPALALTAAALRARTASREGE